MIPTRFLGVDAFLLIFQPWVLWLNIILDAAIHDNSGENKLLWNISAKFQKISLLSSCKFCKKGLLYRFITQNLSRFFQSSLPVEHICEQLFQQEWMANFSFRIKYCSWLIVILEQASHFFTKIKDKRHSITTK